MTPEHVLIPSRGADIECLVRGRGRAVILIASLGRPAQDFDHLAAALAEFGYRAIAVQPRGIGGSTGLVEGLSLDDLAADVAAVIDWTGERGATLIGHAFGNRLARNTALLYPDKVGQVILLACGGQIPMSPQSLNDLAACFNLGIPPEIRLQHIARGFFAPGNDASVWRDGWYPGTAAMQSAAVRGSNHAAWILGGGQPMLIVQALDDVIAPPANALALLDAAPDRLTLSEIANAGHAMLPEQPQAVADAVIGWLSTRL